MSIRPRLSLFIVGLALAGLVGEAAARVVMSGRTEEVRWYDAASQLKVEQMDELGSADLVVAGTSMAWQGFVPSELRAGTGAVAYNAGLAGGTPEVMERWLVEEVVPRLEPTTVVWGLSSFDVAPGWGDQQRMAYDDALATRTGWLGAVERQAAEWSVLVSNRTVLRSLSDTFGAGAEARTAEMADARRTLGDQGERLDFRIDFAPERREVVQARLAGFAPSRDDLNVIGRTIDLLRDEGIEVVLATMPVPDRFVDAHPIGGPGFDAVNIAIADLAARKNVRFIAATEGFDDADFVDYTHLDEASARAFSRGFAAVLESDRDDAARSDELDTGDGLVETFDPIDVPPGCTLLITEDEYGFEVEVLRCGDELDDIDPVVEPDIVRVSAQPLSDRFLFQFGCLGESTDSFDEILEALSPTSSGHLRDALALLDEADAACGTESYVGRFESAVSALELVAGIDRNPIDRTSVTETTSRAIAAVERLRLELEQRNVTRSSGVWFHADEAASRLWLEQREEAGNPVVAVSLGDSASNYAIDQKRFAEAFDGDFLNLAIAGADPEEWRVIQARLFDGITPPQTVLWPLTTHRLLDPPGRNCASLAGPHLRTTIRYRRQLFPELRSVATAPEMIMGPTTDGSPFFESPAAESVANRYIDIGDRVVPEGTFVGIPAGEIRYPDAQFCPERLEDTAATIEALSAAGSAVTVVLLPVHSAVLAESELHAVARQALIETATAAGAAFIELSEPYRDEETFDGWHPNLAGRARVTDQLLAALGLS